MRTRLEKAGPSLAAFLLVSISLLAEAHLMVAQHGTLNVVGNDVYMVLSLPASAFPRHDADGDGAFSMIELNMSRSEIVAAIHSNIKLSDAAGPAELHGVTLSPVMPHEPGVHSISQIVVMGRFALAEEQGPLLFEVGLFGDEEEERQLEITAIRRADEQRQVLEFSPEASAREFF